MILIGDEHIRYNTVEKISSIEDIKSTKSNNTLLTDFSFDIMKYCQKNDLSYIVKVSNIQEVIYANSLDATYMLADQDIVIQAQQLANHYMFDTKILIMIDSSDYIEWVAFKEIDGAIYKNIL